jgi:hypothetical protein
MENVYTDYCKKYDDAVARIVEFETEIKLLRTQNQDEKKKEKDHPHGLTTEYVSGVSKYFQVRDFLRSFGVDSTAECFCRCVKTC